MENKDEKVEPIGSLGFLSSKKMFDLSESLTTSMKEQMFDEMDNCQALKDESSLAIVDLDAIGDDELFVIQSNVNVSPIALLNQRSVESPILDDAASPIPVRSNVTFHVTDTPAHHSKVLGVTQQKNDQAMLPSTTYSHNIVASTPFHNRLLPSCIQKKADGIGAGVANTTYSLDDKSFVKEQLPEPLPLNLTYSEKPETTNTTFTTGPRPVNDATFNKDSAVPVFNPNETFEVKNALDKIPEKGPVSSGSSKSLPKTGKDSRTDSKEENQRTNLRKPLTALNNTANSRLKTPSNHAKQKRMSRLHSPRLNAAAVSRIQANSPLKSETQNENKPQPAKPTGKLAENRKPVPKNKGGRKSLLPPPSGRIRLSLAPRESVNIHKSSEIISLPPQTSNKASNKDTSSPKNTSRRTLSETSFAKPGPAVRSSIPPKSRVASASGALKTAPSKLQKRTSSASALRPRLLVESAKGSSKSCTSLTDKPRVEKRPLPTRKQTDGKKTADNTSQCVVAMATLLNYVVNEINGLSAPQLSREKQRLLAAHQKQKDCADDLSSRVSNLEIALRESRESRDRDLTELAQAHESKTSELNQKHGLAMDELENELAETKQRLLDQENDYEEVISKLRCEYSEKTRELTFNHAENLARMGRNTEAQFEEIREEKRKLEERIDSEVEEKVEDTIKPYLNSFEENNSLRAVIELKSKEHHKLLEELSRRGDQSNEARSLKDLVISLQQKNEDLQTQLKEKSVEHKRAKLDSTELQRQLADQQKVNKILQLRMEELKYRLNAEPSSPMTSFNPVFTQSPISEKSCNGHKGYSGTITFPKEKIKKKGRSLTMTSETDDVIAKTSNGSS